MALEKATLLNITTREVLEVQFNPEEYSLEDGNQFAEFPILGLSAPPLQYIRGSGRSLRLELFFDTTARRTDVRAQTGRLTALLEKDPRTQAPPVLAFSWGGLAFPCVLEKVGQRFTHFLSSGVPLRAYLSVTLREYATATVAVQSGLFVLPPTVRNLVGGETLSQLAAEALGDPSAWRAIAELNGIDNPRTLTDDRGAVLSALALPPRRSP